MTKKTQVPSVGGIRKMLIPQSASALTTITAVLQQVIDAIAVLQTPVNTGGGNIGSGSGGSLALGPGLAGGGPIVGNVPIRLTQPPALIAEDGAEGDMGLQGVPGQRGLQGIPGQPWFGEDGVDGDQGIPGVQGLQGIQGIQGPPGTSGTGSAVPIPLQLFDDDQVDNDTFGVLPIVAPPARVLSAASPVLMLFADDIPAEEFVPNGVPSGPLILNGVTVINAPAALQASLTVIGSGSTFNNPPILIRCNAASAFAFLASGGINTASGFGFNGVTNNFQAGAFNGFGTEIIANSAVAATITTLAATFTSSIGAKGPTPAVTAGQTDIGTTTTTTVITTAGGIALPALANTFWVVNVAGVKLGIPAFAL